VTLKQTSARGCRARCGSRRAYATAWVGVDHEGGGRLVDPETKQAR